jgi:2-hydroxy-4-carboxymuconate semialdehyde hemiacetal dehydrogenase
MVGHTRRFNPSHQYVHNKIGRASSTSSRWTCRPIFPPQEHERQGRAAFWTDHLLWHHAAHTVDLFRLSGGQDRQGQCHRRADPSGAGHRHGHVDPVEGESGAICTLSLSFNNDGPLGTFFRYIGDTGTYIARYDDLVNGKEEPIDVSKVDVSHERHRIAGPRIHRRDPRRARAEFSR